MPMTSQPSGQTSHFALMVHKESALVSKKVVSRIIAPWNDLIGICNEGQKEHQWGENYLFIGITSSSVVPTDTITKGVAISGWRKLTTGVNETLALAGKCEKWWKLLYESAPLLELFECMMTMLICMWKFCPFKEQWQARLMAKSQVDDGSFCTIFNRQKLWCT